MLGMSVTLLMYMGSPTWELSKTYAVGNFMETSSHKHDQLLTPSLASLPSLEDGGAGLKILS